MRHSFAVSTESAVEGFSSRQLSDLLAVETGSESPVQQQFGEEADINTIVERFSLSGELPLSKWRGVYGDFSGIDSFDSAVEKVRAVNARFMELPAEVREKFANSPERLIEFVQSRTEEEFNALVRPPAVEPPVSGGGGERTS